MPAKIITEKPATALSIKLDPEIKQKLVESSQRRGMDLSKLSRAILTNWIEPGRYQV